MKAKSGSSDAGAGEKTRGTPFKSIKSKFYVSFGILIVFFLLVSVAAIGGQSYLDRVVNNLFSTQIRFSELVKASETALLEIQVLERDFLSSYRDRGADAEKALLNEAENQFQAIHGSLREIQQLSVGQENISMAVEFDKAVTEYQKGLTAAATLIAKRIAPGGISSSQIRPPRTGAPRSACVYFAPFGFA